MNDKYKLGDPNVSVTLLNYDHPVLVFKGETVGNDPFEITVEVQLLESVESRREVEILITGIAFSHNYALHDESEASIINTCMTYTNLVSEQEIRPFDVKLVETLWSDESAGVEAFIVNIVIRNVFGGSIEEYTLERFRVDIVTAELVADLGIALNSAISDDPKKDDACEILISQHLKDIADEIERQFFTAS